jgi:arylsulfatase A-like enzyme
VRGPGFSSGIDDNPTQHQDIAATMAAIASVTPGVSPLDGIDLRTTDPDRELLHQLGDATGTGAAGRPIAEGITTKTRKLFRYDETGADEFEMYDLDTDPTELLNVANDAGRLTERNALEAALDALTP